MTITTVTGQSIRGQVADFDLSSQLVVVTEEDGERLAIPAADVVSLAGRAVKRLLPGPSVTLRLAGGDRLVGLVSGAADEILAVENPSLSAAAQVALTRIEALITSAARQPEWQSRVQSFLARPPEEEDRVLLANGDVVRGLIASIDETGIEIEVDEAARRLGYETVIAASLVAADAVDVKGRRARVSLDDGTVISVGGLVWRPKTGLCVDFAGDRLCLMPERVTRLEMLGGRWQWLAALSPVSVEHTAMMSVGWEHQVNRSVTGTPLRVGGETFEHGIGVHSRSSLTYELKGEYREFVTRFGLDRTAGPLASVEVVIRVDGRTCFRQQVRAPSALCGPIRIPIGGARTLELLVDFADNGAIQDRFDWIEPGLVR